MKLRILAIIFTAFFLSACTFSLAEDVTPPPNYVPPTPMPTLGPLFPAEAPSIENGKAIYAEKCAACHGLSL
jgi:mono/diheme cytochrome c family protein